jgi:hypothetical protein
MGDVIQRTAQQSLNFYNVAVEVVDARGKSRTLYESSNIEALHVNVRVERYVEGVSEKEAWALSGWSNIRSGSFSKETDDGIDVVVDRFGDGWRLRVTDKLSGFPKKQQEFDTEKQAKLASFDLVQNIRARRPHP